MAEATTNAAGPHEKWRLELTDDDLAYANELRNLSVPKLAFARDFRKAMGLTQVQAADLLGTTQSNVSKIERGGDFSLSSIATLARARHKRITILVENEAGEPEASFALP